MSDDVLRMQPSEVAEATHRLDDLADRIDRLMSAEHSHLVVAPAARDEVSRRVAATLTDVHTSFTASTRDGVADLRNTASRLRAQADDVSALDGSEL